MADASHELRTPIAIVRGESEVALSKENRPLAELRESLEIVNDETKRLTDKARSRQSETLASGAGLELSIALWIAELHRGSIKIVSSSDAGSVFAIELPMSK